MSLHWLQTVARLIALTAALLIGADDADARAVGGLNGGSPAALIRTSLVVADGGVTRRAALTQLPPAGGSLSDFFRRGGLLGGFAAGFLGCGLLGLLFGRGLLGGLDGVPSYLGLLFQLALLLMLGRLIWSRWRHVDFAGVADLSPRQLADPYLRSRDDVHARFDSPSDDQNTASQSGRAGKVKEGQSRRD
jgi:predicted lipid-binding transport protein (Tim44 family)